MLRNSFISFIALFLFVTFICVTKTYAAAPYVVGKVVNQFGVGIPGATVTWSDVRDVCTNQYSYYDADGNYVEVCSSYGTENLSRDTTTDVNGNYTFAPADNFGCLEHEHHITASGTGLSNCSTVNFSIDSNGDYTKSLPDVTCDGPVPTDTPTPTPSPTEIPKPTPTPNPAGSIQASGCKFTQGVQNGCSVAGSFSVDRPTSIQVFEKSLTASAGSLAQGKNNKSNVLGASTIAQSYGTSIYGPTTFVGSHVFTVPNRTTDGNVSKDYQYTLVNAGNGQVLAQATATVEEECGNVCIPIPTIVTTGTGVGNCVGTTVSFACDANPANVDQVRAIVARDNNLSDIQADSGWVDIQQNQNGSWSYSFTRSYLTTGSFFVSTAARQSTPLNCKEASPLPTAGVGVTVDVSAPGTPVTPAASFNSSTKAVSWSWSPSTDSGCASCNGYASQYWLQGYWSDGTWYENASPTVAPGQCSSSQTLTSASIPTPANLNCNGHDGDTVYLGVRTAKDDAGNESAEQTLLGSYTCPTPTLYPTAAVSGKLREYLGSGASCQDNISTSALALGITPASAPGVTTTCSYSSSGNTRSTYNCNVKFDNQGTKTVNPSQTFTLNAAASSYASPNGYFVATNACSATGTNTVALASGDVKSQDIEWNAAAGSPWIKTKNTSVSSMGDLNFPIPLNVASFDSDDDGTRVFDLPNAGAVTADGSINIGTASVSSNGWRSEGGSARNVTLRYSDYIDYVKARRSYQSISTLSDIVDNKINIGGDLTIGSTAQLNGKKVVIASTGTVTITSNLQFAAGTAVAIVANQITIDPSVTRIDAILIANSVLTGSSSTNRLKINGNISTLTASQFNQQRTTTDYSKPVIFVKNDSSMYISLLDLLSISVYDWRQLQ